MSGMELMLTKLKYCPWGAIRIHLFPFQKDDPKILAVREALGVSPDQLMILTVGGDAASKGAQEVMQALAIIDNKAPDWKYVWQSMAAAANQNTKPGRSSNGE